MRSDLGAGESEAIVLAQQLKPSLLLIDERLGNADAQYNLDPLYSKGQGIAAIESTLSKTP